MASDRGSHVSEGGPYANAASDGLERFLLAHGLAAAAAKANATSDYCQFWAREGDSLEWMVRSPASGARD